VAHARDMERPLDLAQAFTDFDLVGDVSKSIDTPIGAVKAKTTTHVCAPANGPRHMCLPTSRQRRSEYFAPAKK